MEIKMPTRVSPAVLLIVAIAVLCPRLTAAQDAPAKVQPVDYRKLKELMPETLAGQKRTSNEGQKLAMGEFALSNAHAQYSGDADAADAPHISVEIVDYGAQPQVAEGMAIWANMEIDREGDDGYERTRKLGDHPAHEQYHNEGQSGQLMIFVGQRFLVTVSTTRIPAEQLAVIGQALPLDKLASLR
jgi:hypothetical protein